MTSEVGSALDDLQDLSMRLIDLTFLSACSTSFPTSRSAEVTHIDDAEQQLRAAIASIRQARNNFSFINRLPTELLCAIFVEVLHMKLNKYSPYRRARDLYSVLTVCRLWHRVVSTSPVLWATVVIFCTAPAAHLDDLLGRSGSFPLQVSVQGGGSKGSRSLQPFLSHMSRIHKLHFDVNSSPLETDISFLTCPAPNLRTLSLRVRYVRRLPELFSGEAPLLTRLRLTLKRGLWPARAFSNLTHLYVQGGLLTMDSILNFVKASPDLEEIVLSNVTLAISYDEFLTIPEHQVALPCARTIHLQSCRWQDVACVMRMFTFPNGIAVALDRIGGVASFPMLLPDHTSFLPYLGEVAELCLWVSEEHITMVCCHPSSPFKLDFMLEHKETCYHLMSTFINEHIPQVLHVDGVVGLQVHFDLPVPLTQEFVRPLLCSMSSVESYTIWDNPQHRMAWSYLLSCRNGILLPRLQELRVVSKFPASGFDPSWMLGLAASRALHDHRIRSLRCTAAMLPRADIAAFKRWGTLVSEFRGKRVDSFVDSVEFDAVEDNPMERPIIVGWDGEI